MSEKMRGETSPEPSEIKFSDRKIGHTEAEGYTQQDERRDEPTAKQAHEWTRHNNLYIRNPMWGSGDVVDKEGRAVEESSLPDFVKEHIAFRGPNQDEE